MVCFTYYWAFWLFTEFAWLLRLSYGVKILCLSILRIMFFISVGRILRNVSLRVVYAYFIDCQSFSN